MKNSNMLKMVGIICTVIGCGITIIQDQIKSKEMENTIADEVDKKKKKKSQSDEF